ncbi:hypothetical protein AGMMS4957_20200 [Bacteroidia bacterium]|nr:hypothetical protein AGMMS4957_20200 [Bacteroidia bacterium]
MNETGNGFVVAGVDVKKEGMNIDVNSISTVFNKEGNITQNESIIYESETITPQQKSVLESPNRSPYPSDEEVCADKGTTNNLNNQTTNTEAQGKRIKNGSITFGVGK